MDYASKLLRLQHLLELVEKCEPLRYGSTDEGIHLYQEICEVYGEVSDVFDEVVGRGRIDVPLVGSPGSVTYPNFFEAGFLSGRTIHSHQGKTELLRIIGHCRWHANNLGRIESDPWSLMHPTIVEAGRDRMESEHYADAAEAAMKAVNARVKASWLASGRPEKDGKQLMLAAFSVNNPVLRLADLSTESGRNIQEGYMHLFAGAMQGIRNPKAHDNLTISKKLALHFLMLASLLMSKLDELESPYKQLLPTGGGHARDGGR